MLLVNLVNEFPNGQILEDASEVKEVCNSQGISEESQESINAVFVVYDDFDRITDVYVTEDSDPFGSNSEYDMVDYWVG